MFILLSWQPKKTEKWPPNRPGRLSHQPGKLVHDRHFAPVSLRIYSRRVKIPGTISGTIPLIRSGWECSELNCFQREREKREVSRKKIYRQHPTRGRQKTLFIKDITAVYNDIYWSRKQSAVTPARNEFAREKCPPYTPKSPLENCHKLDTSSPRIA